MKKLFCTLLALLLCLAPALAAFADGEPYENAYELYASWDAYPDYLAGVWSTDGSYNRLTFGLIENAGEAEKEEILSQVRDKDTVSFAEGCKYSYAELRAVREALDTYLREGESGAYGMGIDESENRLIVEIDASAPGAAEFMARVAAEYGDMVEFEAGSGAAAEDSTVEYVGSDAAQPDPLEPPLAVEPMAPGMQAAPAVGVLTELGTERQGAAYWLPAVLAVCLILGGLVVLKQKGLIFRAAEGPEAARPRPAFRRVEAEIRNSAETPDDRLYQAVMEKIEKTDK